MINGANWQEGTLDENLVRVGVLRCSFMRFCGTMMAIFAAGTPNVGEAAAQSLTPSTEGIVDKLSVVEKPKAAWLQLQECTGYMESVLRSEGTTAGDVVLNLVSMDYNKLFMTPSKHTAEKALDDMNTEDHILMVNGSIPAGENGAYYTIGGRPAEQALFEAIEKATVILAVGAYAVWGPVQAAKSNPTGTKGADEIIEDKPVTNISGYPPVGEVITATLTCILTYDKAPRVDAGGRPKFAYDQRIHDSCPRRVYFDAGQLVKMFNDEGACSSWCPYEIGCKRPPTFSSCPIVQWNLKSGWPIGAGRPCIGCTEKDFFNQLTLFHGKLPGILGAGVKSSANEVGIGLLAATAAGAAVYDGLALAKELKIRHSNGEEKVSATFGGVGGQKSLMVDLLPNSPSTQSETTSDSEDS